MNNLAIRRRLYVTLADFDLTNHARFHVTRKKAGKVNGSGLRKLPDETTLLARIDRDHIGLGMFHSRHFLHHGGMLFEFCNGADHHFMRDLAVRSEEHTSELQSLMRISYAVFCLKKKKNK